MRHPSSGLLPCAQLANSVRLKCIRKLRSLFLAPEKTVHNWCADSVVEQSGGPEMYNFDAIAEGC